MKNLLLCLLLLVSFAACKSSKEAVDQYRYFDKNLDTLNSLVNKMKEPILLEGDQLNIQVFSGTLNQDQVQVFVLPSEQQTGYTVDAEGNINMPVLGKIHVQGLEKPAAEKLILDQLQPYVKNPVVSISFLNFRILTLGEVLRPGYQLVSEKATVLEALGQAGGLTDAGQRTNLLIIRQLPEGKKEYGRLNLNDARVFASPYFQLQQHDIIYALPNDTKLKIYARQNNPLFRDLPVYLGLLASIISIVSITVLLSNKL